MWHPGASRQDGANEAYLSRCFSAPPPNFNVVDSGVWQLQKDHVFEIPEVNIEIGGVGGESAQEVVWIHSLARCVFLLWMEVGKGIWIQQGFGRLIRRPLQYAIWRRFLHLNEYLRNFTPDTANATIDAHARGLTEHLVQFLAEWIIMALEPARVITKVRAPDFLFLHDKDFWFKQIWVDLHQTMVLDRQGSYTRPVIGLVRCVCKDETEQTGRSSPIKIRICNLHFFAPIWMAQPIVRNFRRMSMANLKPREPGFINYKEGWYEWDGRGNMKKKLLRVTLWAASASWLLITMLSHFITTIGDPLNTLLHKAWSRTPSGLLEWDVWD